MNHVSSPQANSSTTSKYLPFVDGLRAIAIIGVVLYHARIPGVSGGFVGVDVFFVISGFLIIGHIWDKLSEGRFSFSEFWARRVLRILPAYLIVLLFSVIAAPFVFVLPGEFTDFGWQVVWSSLMAANHFFLEQQGYFDAAAETKALRHLWSLAVEEQFYLVAPVGLSALFLISARFGRAVFGSAVAIIFFASFALCVLGTGEGTEKNYAFFLMPARIWEFAAGGMVVLAMPMLRGLPSVLSAALGLLGVAIVLGTMAMLPADVHFPSGWAAIPVLGTVAVLAGGLAAPRALVPKVLSLPPMVGLGLVSYAWYLWHWPIQVFARTVNFGQVHYSVDVAAVILALILAVFTYRLVERPIRIWRNSIPGNRNGGIIAVGFSACLLIAAVGGGFVQFGGTVFASSAAPGFQPVVPPVDRHCRVDLMDGPDDCMARGNGGAVGIVMGDSHAKAAFPVLQSRVEAAGGVLVNLPLNGCAPFFEVSKYLGVASIQACARTQRKGMNWLASGQMSLDFAILVAQWNIHTKGLAEPSEASPARDQRRMFEKKLQNTVEILRAGGVERVLIVLPVPTMKLPAPECLLRADKYGQDRDALCSLSRTQADSHRKSSVAWIKHATEGLADVRIIDPLAVFCDKKWCKPYVGNTALYTDASHLSDAGVALIYDQFADDFAWVTAQGH